MDFGSLVTSVFSGGADVIFGSVFGVVGSVITHITDYKMRKLENQEKAAARDHELRMIDAETKAMVAESQANISVARVQTDGLVAVEETRALRESYAAEAEPALQKSYLDRLLTIPWLSWLGAIVVFFLGVVDFLKKLVRPAATYYSLAALTWITYLSYRVLEESSGGVLLPGDAFEIFQQVVHTIIILSTTIISWWFCDRRLAKNNARRMQAATPPKETK